MAINDILPNFAWNIIHQIHHALKEEVFQSRLAGLSADSLAKYRRSLLSLEAFMNGHGLTETDLSSKIVDDWTCDLLRQDKARTTIIRNLNVLSSVLKGTQEANLKEAASRARELARRFESSAPATPPLLQERVFNIFLTLFQAWLKGVGTPDVYRDIVLVSLMQGCLPLRDVAMIRKDSVYGFSGLTAMLLERNISTKRGYVFDLRQSYQTPRQVEKGISDTLLDKFGKYVGVEGFDADELIRSIWVAMAMRCGATASVAFGCVEGAAGYSVPDFVSPSPEDRFDSDRWGRAVGMLLEQDAPRWYAMQMRRGVSFEELQKEIAAEIRPMPTLFYPCQNIARNAHNRRVLKTQPFITQTVFFRMSPDGVLPMFAKIGDKAWCYRLFNSPEAPYAVIPRQEMQRFQSAIGQFTSDMEIHPIGEIAIKPEDKVVLLMADFYNQEGKVAKVVTEEGGTTIYRVVFRDNSGFEWTVNADTRQLKPV